MPFTTTTSTSAVPAESGALGRVAGRTGRSDRGAATGRGDRLVPQGVLGTDVIDQRTDEEVGESEVLPLEKTPVRGRFGSKPDKPSARKVLVEWVLVLGGAAFVALVVRLLLVQVFFIPSASMEPTLRIDDNVLVDKVTQRFTDVKRGEVIVFPRPAGLPDDAIKDLVKRVIAVEGDTIEATQGQVYVNGLPIDEPYLATPLSTDNLPRTTVGAGQLFVMGDNRQNSTDSRVFGPIPESTVIGHARAVIMPFGHRNWLSIGEGNSRS